MKNHKGFTLIEMMIVVAIIGILSAVAIPNFVDYREKLDAENVVTYINEQIETITQSQSSPEMHTPDLTPVIEEIQQQVEEVENIYKVSVPKDVVNEDGTISYQ